MNPRYLDIVQPLVPGAATMELSRPFEELGVDSFDLLSIRVEFERLLRREIPDTEWTRFESFAQLFAYADQAGGTTTQASDGAMDDGAGYARRFEINMPHMALEGLSESWLFKELGAAHWELLCRGLGQRSSDLKDELGNRLYATFARVQHAGTVSMADFTESERVELAGQIHRFGGGMYYSEFALNSLDNPERSIAARLITSFSRRGDTGNKDLVKSQPSVSRNSIESLDRVPPFIDEYRLVKKGEKDRFALGDAQVAVSDEIVATTDYELNPYHDLNGVGLLYFAAYPIIADTCEARLFNGTSEPDGLRWEQRWRTRSRDVMYYANCDITDAVVYRLHSIERTDDRVATVASLSRRSDGVLMARIATVKSRQASPPAADSAGP